jgi:PiT family inorganic phosphate transporter
MLGACGQYAAQQARREGTIMELAAVIVLVIVALTFAFTNGFYDAATVIATSVSTHALSPRTAVAIATVTTFVGAFIGTGVAVTVASGIIAAPRGSGGLVVVFGALVGAIVWNLATWCLGLANSSSSHALIGGLVGAGLASGTGVRWSSVLDKVVVPMIVSPVVGFAGAYLLHVAVLWTFRGAARGRVNRGFRIAQSCSAAAMGVGHGLQDAQKTMGVIVLALVTVGLQHSFHVPVWVIVAVAAAMAAGTWAGGRRIVPTLRRPIVRLDPPRGFAAETTAASILYAAAFLWHAPISTTHTVTAAAVGAGSTRRLSAVRWDRTRTIVTAWVLTMPGAALAAAATYLIAHAVTST